MFLASWPWAWRLPPPLQGSREGSELWAWNEDLGGGWLSPAQQITKGPGLQEFFLCITACFAHWGCFLLGSPKSRPWEKNLKQVVYFRRKSETGKGGTHTGWLKEQVTLVFLEFYSLGRSERWCGSHGSLLSWGEGAGAVLLQLLSSQATPFSWCSGLKVRTQATRRNMLVEIHRGFPRDNSVVPVSATFELGFYGS